MNRSVLIFSFLFMVGLASTHISNAQVSLAPTSLYIHDQTNVTSLYVNNNSQETQEVSITMEFGYPGSDEQGEMVTVSDDTLSAARYGLTNNLRIFPRQFVLKPGSQQTVRVQVRPMNGKTDGVYWTRVIISSNTAAKDVESVPVADGIGTRINYVFKQNIPAFYLKGKLKTGLTSGEVVTHIEEGKLVAISRLVPTGNAPFNGSVTARLSDSKGEEVAMFQQSVVAYFSVLRRIELPLPADGLPRGHYTLDFLYETMRADIDQTDLVQAAPVKNSVSVEVK